MYILEHQSSDFIAKKNHLGRLKIQVFLTYTLRIGVNRFINTILKAMTLLFKHHSKASDAGINPVKNAPKTLGNDLENL